MSSADPQPESSPVTPENPSNPPVPPSNEALPPAPPPAEEGEEFDDYEPLTPELVEDEAIRGDFVLKWAVVLLAFLLGSTRIGENATLLHVKTGQYLAAHGFLPPANDVFSYTASDRPWTNLSWGFDLFSAGVYAAGSFVGLSVVKSLLAAGLFGLIVSISRPGLPTWWGSVCAALALLACHTRLTFQPTLVTLFGAALVLWLLNSWRQNYDRRRLWLLIPLLFVWCNFDSRAYVGLMIVWLYAAGEALGGVLGFSALPGGQKKPLWLAAGLSLAATLLHPFTWKSLTTPLLIYGTEYPAFREYITGAYLEQNKLQVPGASSLIFFPMSTEAFWTNLDLAGLAALVVIAACLVVFILNRSRIELGQVAVFLGAIGLAFLCLHELAVASVICCVLATLNGQAWYAATFRQEYSVETSELVFSRGGRALTVISFAAIAFFGGTGRLRDVQAPRTGYGIDQNLAVLLDDLSKQLAGDKSFDHKPFNFYLSQGDQLIWVGEQVFADSRVSVYHAERESENILAIHLQTRDALGPAREGKAGQGRAAVWKNTLNEYGVTHLVPRLKHDVAGILDNLMLVSLLQDERNWRLTSLGASAAVLYRRQLPDATENERLQAYLAEHTLDFQKLAFRQSGELIAARDKWIRPPGFYEKYFWSAKRDIPGPIQEALHLVRLASLTGLPQEIEDSRPAIALLAARKAQAGLEASPDSSTGYFALGQAYQILGEWESLASLNGSRSPYVGTRYLQAVAAYNQTLIGDPKNVGAIMGLMSLYQGAQRHDLALAQMESLEALWADDTSIEPSQLLALSQGINRLKALGEKLQEKLDSLPAGTEGGLQRASVAQSEGFVLQALKELDAEASRMSGNLVAEQSRILLLLEAGRVEEAHEAAERFAEPAQRAGMVDWETTVALANLPEADYRRSSELWAQEVEQLEQRSFGGALMNLAPKPGNWPLGTINAAVDLLYQSPATASQVILEHALIRLEEGQLPEAERLFRECLRTHPETPYRGLIAHYLYEITGKDEIDLLPPSEQIPPLFAPEAGDEGEPGA